MFKTIDTEVKAADRYWRANGRILFRDILKAELADGRRIIEENDAAVAFVPYFARYAYEIYISPRETHTSIAQLNDDERTEFAELLRSVLARLDNLWRMPFPYVMALHQAPTDGLNYRSFHFHIELHPPLRTPNLIKYLAGPEIGGGNFLSDTSPEAKAAEVCAQSTTHYLASGARLV